MRRAARRAAMAHRAAQPEIIAGMPDIHPAVPRRAVRAMSLLEDGLMQAADAITARLPTTRPSKDVLEDARIVAHRGIYDNRHILENTLPAFDAVLAAGLWGLECDVRWTRDHQAVVHHDPDGRRFFGDDRPIETLTFRQLKQACPLIPPLETVVQRYAKRLHLMIEVKAAPGICQEDLNRSLSSTLAALVPGVDYHLMSLSLELLSAIDSVPREACLPIARLNTQATLRAVVANGYGGMAGHYALIGRRGVAALHREGRRIGTGFVNSRGCLYREMARGIDWLFSDRGLDLQRIITRHRTGV